ncbi:MAG: histidinol-phosphate aminotransferase family protein [Eudoraea sp.]|nr:histidinol-phosphate aminotransferase family protein [Eudoraea sp.]
MQINLKSIVEKGGASFKGISLLLCENPLPPLQEAIDAAKNELPLSNFYTEPYSAKLRELLSRHCEVPISMVHINAGSELILRQLFDLYGQQVHLLTPTYVLFPQIAKRYTETRILPQHEFRFNLKDLSIPDETTLVVIVNPNNPNGLTMDLQALPNLLEKHKDTYFLVDEAFIGLAGRSVAPLVPRYKNLLVTRTFSKAHSLAGFRVGYAILPEHIAEHLNNNNDAYPLARASEAAAIATLQHVEKIHIRMKKLKLWARDLSESLQGLGIKTYPTETYFFLADFAPLNAGAIARAFEEKGFLLKPLDDAVLGEGYMRITTSTPENNQQFIQTLKELLK